MTRRPLRNSTKPSFLASAGLGMAPRLVTVVVAIAQSPYIVSKVGLAAFGYWSVVLAILQYAGIAGEGYPTIATRIVSRGLSSDDQDEVRRAVAQTALVSTGVGAVVVAAGLIGPSLVPSSVADSLPHGWQSATTLGTVSLSFLMLSNSLAAATRGFGRWDLDAVASVVGQLMGAAATTVFLMLGLGMTGLGLAACVFNGSMALVYGGVAIWLGALGPAKELLAGRIFREMRAQGTQLQISAFVGATNAQADRFLLIPFASLSWIGAYALGARVAVSLRAFPLTIFGPLMVRFSDAHAKGGEEDVKALYVRSTAAISAYVITSLVVVYFAMFPAVLAWLGPSYTVSATAAVLLGFAYTANVLTGPGTSVAIACGRAQLVRNYTLLGLAINLAATFTLGPLFGAWGVVVATGLGLSLSSTWLIWSVDRWLNVSTVSASFHEPSSKTMAFSAVLIAAASIPVTLAIGSGSRLVNLGLSALLIGTFGLIALVANRSRVQRWFSTKRKVRRVRPVEANAE